MTKLPSQGLYRAELDQITLTTDTWYLDAAYTTAWDFNAPVTGNLDLYAKWTEPSPVDLAGQSGDHVLAKALNYIAGQSLSEETPYAVVLAGNYSLAGVSAANINTAQAVITLVGASPVELSLSSNGALFYIGAGELVLDKNITLTGLSSNDTSLVRVDGSSASLTMRAGATIRDNSAASSGSSGGGVAVYLGTFNKTGGIIYGDADGTHTAGSTENTAGTTYGHAVYYYVDNSNEYYRDATLNAGDNISTGDALPANSGDSLNNWTKK
jgi:uncharacterized repeat protein (TIGR02543 family)